MAGPFHNNVRGTSSGSAGTGAFTPSGAVTGGRAWSTVPAGWIGLVRYEDGTAAELRYSYWNGTTLTRAANAFVWSTSGSGLNLGSSATASLVADGAEVQPHLGGNHNSMFTTLLGANTIHTFGMVNTNLGTPSAKTLATTNFLTEQPAHIGTSGTAANNAAGFHGGTSPRAIFSTTAGRGGGEMTCRFGASQLPTGPRLWCGWATAINSSAADPSTYTNILHFGKDSADTNIQFMHNDGSGSATKIDTGIPWAANAFYEATVWWDPGGGRAYALLIRLDTGDVFYREVTTDLPANGSLMIPIFYGSLSATTGTAIIVHCGTLHARTGA